MKPWAIRLTCALLTKPMTRAELAAATGCEKSTVENFIRDAHAAGLVFQAGLRAMPRDADGRKPTGRKPGVWCVQPLPFFHRDYNHSL